MKRKNVEAQLKQTELELVNTRKEREDLRDHCGRLEQQTQEMHRALELCNNDLQGTLEHQDREMKAQVGHWVHRWQVEAQTRHDTDAQCVALETRCKDLERQVCVGNF